MSEHATLTSRQRVLAQGIMFGESPRWHDGRLWMSDMFDGKVLAISESGQVEKIVEVAKKPSGLGWLPDGTLLIVSMQDWRLLAFSKGQLTDYADLRLCRGSPNDMIVDATGRAYVGNIGCDLYADGQEPTPTNLLLIENGIAREVADDLLVPNGMIITPDQRTLIVAETLGRRLTAFDISPSDGSLSRRRLFADLGNRTPDGICLDAENAVWVSSPFTGEFIRVREGGQVSAVISANGQFATACATGGADRRTLFLLIADWNTALPRSESRARVEVADLLIPGALS